MSVSILFKILENADGFFFPSNFAKVFPVLQKYIYTCMLEKI